MYLARPRNVSRARPSAHSAYMLNRMWAISGAWAKAEVTNRHG